MKYAIGACLGCLCFAATPAVARDTDTGRWVTFKTSRHGQIEHQIDRMSIEREGPYQTFWTRLWDTRAKSPLALSRNEQLFFWSQKFTVDCMNRKMGRDFLDSTEPGEIKKKTTLQHVRWENLDRMPVVGQVVCRNK